MIDHGSLFKLRQEYCGDIPTWMIWGGYDVAKIRELMQGWAMIYQPDAVFFNADKYLVVIGRHALERETYDFNSFADALQFTTTYLKWIDRFVDRGRPYLYAVCQGHHKLLPQERWPFYARLWVMKRTCNVCGVYVEGTVPKCRYCGSEL